MNDIIINKIQSIQRCVKRAKDEYENAGNGFDSDYTRQDAAILNVIRACEQTIDLANHLIKIKKIGIPNSSSESFEILVKNSIIPLNLGDSLKEMVGFRNKVTHEYQRIDSSLVKNVIKKDMNDLLLFTEKILDDNE